MITDKIKNRGEKIDQTRDSYGLSGSPTKGRSDEEKTHDKHLIKKKTKEEMAQVMAELDKMFDKWT